MKRIDHFDLDGRTLRLFLAIYEEGSVTGAARRLGLTQSAVSHGIVKLRTIVGDDLFVRAGRGIAPTRRAEELVLQARRLLRSMRAFAEAGPMDPANVAASFTFGASDHPRELLLPALVGRLRREAPRLDLRVLHAGLNEAELLRTRRCDLMITPNPPDGTEFVQQRLFEDHWLLFFDAAEAGPPQDLDDYLGRPHAKVVFSADERGRIDQLLERDGHVRRVALRVQGFAALPTLMRGTDVVACLPARLADTVMRGFATCPSPLELAPIGFYMVWHRRDQQAPLHSWVRGLVKAAAGELGAVGA